MVALRPEPAAGGAAASASRIGASRVGAGTRGAAMPTSGPGAERAGSASRALASGLLGEVFLLAFASLAPSGTAFDCPSAGEVRTAPPPGDAGRAKSGGRRCAAATCLRPARLPLGPAGRRAADGPGFSPGTSAATRGRGAENSDSVEGEGARSAKKAATTPTASAAGTATRAQKWLALGGALMV